VDRHFKTAPDKILVHPKITYEFLEQATDNDRLMYRHRRD